MACSLAPPAFAENIGYKVQARFTEPVTNSDGSTLLDLNEYRLQVRDGSTTVDSQTLAAQSAAPTANSEVNFVWPALTLTQGKTYTLRLRACDLPATDNSVRCSNWVSQDFRVPVIAEIDVPNIPVIIEVTGTIVEVTP